MTSRQNIVLLAVAALLAVAPASARAETRWERTAREKREIAKSVIWPSHEPLMFSLRRGGHSEDLPDIYERQHAPGNLQDMARAGVRFGRLHFYKGMGLQMEAEEMAKSLRMAGIMHDLGMKVSLYVAGTMFAEVFYEEVPEARNWEQRDQNGRWVPYGAQTFRHYPCPNEPAHISTPGGDWTEVGSPSVPGSPSSPPGATYRSPPEANAVS